MKREIKLNNKLFNIDEVVSISDEGKGSQYFLIENLQSANDYRFTFTKNFIKTENKMIQPKDIEDIQFNKNIAKVNLIDGRYFELPIENISIKSDSFIFEMKKTKKEKNGIAVWKVLSNIDESLRELKFLREN